MALTKKQKQLIEQAAKEIRGMKDWDPESAHSSSDQVLEDLLDQLGAGEVIKARNELIESMPWWACA